MRDVERVLAGQADYDDLPAREQAIVRTEWAERIAASLPGLDFKREFTAAGKSYAELDEHGQAVVRHPPEQQALLRRAQERLRKIDDINAAVALHAAGHSQDEIAETLGTTQPRVHRLLKAHAAGEARIVTPEEIILRATVDGTSRSDLVDALSRYPYTFTRYAPGPFDGSKPGTWLQVSTAVLTGFLTEREFEQIAEAVRPPTA